MNASTSHSTPTARARPDRGPRTIKRHRLPGRIWVMVGLLLYLVFPAASLCYANPVVPPSPFDYWPILIPMLLLTLMTELAIVVGFVKQKVRPGSARRRLYSPVLVMNFVTFIATQLVAHVMVARSWDFFALLLPAELVPFVVEPIWLRHTFNRLHETGFFTERISNPRLISIVLVANLYTFLLGLTVFMLMW